MLLSFVLWCANTTVEYFEEPAGDEIPPWCANTTVEYFEEPIGEEIPNDLQPAEEEREWRADDV